MNHLLIDCTSVGARLTGIERYEREVGGRLARLKRQEGWKVTLLISAMARKQLGDWIADMAAVAEVHASPFTSKLMTQQVWIPFMAWRQKADTAFFASFPPSPAMFKLLRGTIRVVRTMHDAVLWSSPTTTSIKNALYFGPLERWGARRYYLVHTVSAHARDDILTYVPALEDRIVVSGGGVSALPESRFDSLDRMGIRQPFFLSVGTLEPRKNLPFLIDVFQRFRRHDPNIQLVLAGRFGWGAGEIERAIVKSELQGHVVLTGAISDAELAALYHRALALLFPSLHEGFGLPLVEAMSAGLPVVSSNVTSMPEVCGDAALLVPPSDATRWLEAMMAVSGDQALREALVVRGKARAAEFSWDRVASRVSASMNPRGTILSLTA